MSSTLEWAMDIQLKRMNWPTQQSFFCKSILGIAKKSVCPLVNSLAVCLRGDCPLAVKRLSPEMWSALSRWRSCPSHCVSTPHSLAKIGGRGLSARGASIQACSKQDLRPLESIDYELPYF